MTKKNHLLIGGMVSCLWITPIVVQSQEDAGFVLPPPLFEGTMQFQSPTSIDDRDIVTGDFNNDGFLDVATANGSLTVDLGRGDGTFIGTIVSGNSMESGLVSIDFDKDGMLDVISFYSVFEQSSKVTWGNGDGSFSSRQLLGQRGGIGTVGDFNNNGFLEIIYNRDSGILNLIAHESTAVPINPRQLITSQITNFGGLVSFTQIHSEDFNNDGNLDIAGLIPSSDRFFVMLGNGDLTFQDPQQFTTGNAPNSMTLGDLNNDGNIDVIVSALDEDNTDIRVINYFPGPGNGSFPGFAEYQVGTRTIRGIQFGQFVGDQNPDIALIRSDYLQYMEGDGTGSLLWREEFNYIGANTQTYLEDVNNDAQLDAITRSTFRNTYQVTLGGEDGSFPVGNFFDTADARDMEVVDINGDNIADVVVANNATGASAIDIFVGAGDGTFENFSGPSRNYAHPRMVVADVNHDGSPDIITAGRVQQSPARYGMIVNYNDGSGGFIQSQIFDATDLTAIACDVGFFNEDELYDLVVTGWDSQTDQDAVFIFMSNGTGNFDPPISFLVGDYPNDVLVADVSGDGIEDIVTANLGASTVTVILGTQTGFNSSLILNYGTVEPPSFLDFGDFTEDGISDLATSNGSSQSVSILPGTGTGFFDSAIKTEFSVSLNDLQVIDVNGDSLLDVIVGTRSVNSSSDFGPYSALVAYGAGDGTFAGFQLYETYNNTWDVSLNDFNGDEIPDLAATISSDLVVLTGINPTTGTMNQGNNPPTGGILGIVLSAEISDQPIDPDGDNIRYSVVWNSDGDDTPIDAGDTTSTLFILREEDGVTFNEGETWTITVTPIDSEDAEGTTLVGTFFIGTAGTVEFRGWRIF